MSHEVNERSESRLSGVEQSHLTSQRVGGMGVEDRKSLSNIWKPAESSMSFQAKSGVDGGKKQYQPTPQDRAQWTNDVARMEILSAQQKRDFIVQGPPMGWEKYHDNMERRRQREALEQTKQRTKENSNDPDGTVHVKGRDYSHGKWTLPHGAPQPTDPMPAGTFQTGTRNYYVTLPDASGQPKTAGQPEGQIKPPVSQPRR